MIACYNILGHEAVYVADVQYICSFGEGKHLGFVNGMDDKLEVRSTGSNSWCRNRLYHLFVNAIDARNLTTSVMWSTWEDHRTHGV